MRLKGKKQGAPTLARGYEAKRAYAAALSAAKSVSGRDIGPPPDVVDPARRDGGRNDFSLFCRTYYPHCYALPWSPDHLRMIERIEAAVLRGGKFAYGMPRGSGKTTLAETAVQWAAFYGHRRFPVLIGSDESSAVELLHSIKMEVECNDLLFEDFPEVCYPIRRLEGIAHRANGQLSQGRRTHITWTADELVLPTIEGAASSGVVIRVAGLTGRVRGMKFKTPDGQNVRPDLVILDDPQTDESARSPSQCSQREKTIAGAVLNMGGPGRKIAALMPCTVIAPRDLADSLLDREKHPEWQGERTKLVYSFPTDEALWDKYAKVRADGLRHGDDGKAGTKFYADNRAGMDAGSVVAWAERYNEDDLSAIQHAMNLKLDLGPAFFAEYQNEPVSEEVRGEELTAEAIAAKLNRFDRGAVPSTVQRLTAFIDVQKAALFWAVVGWEEDFGGYLVDYGCYPDQNRDYFTLGDVRHTVAQAVSRRTGAKAIGLEETIFGGLEDLTARLCSREFKRDDGATLRVERCLIDANWGESTDVVYKFCRQSAHSAVLLPSHGKYVGAASVPFSEYRRKEGDRVGHNWRIPSVAKRRAIRYVLFDANYWKSFLMERLATPAGGRGCLSIFGDDPQVHRMLADHLTGERGIRTEGRGRHVIEWKAKVGRENHWLDCLVGCCVAASERGVSMKESIAVRSPVRKIVRLRSGQLGQKRIIHHG